MKNASLININNVTRIYSTVEGETHALDTIDLDIKEGEFLSVLGPSGCGKSTLLMLISGLIPPTTGTITTSDKKIQKPYTGLGIVFRQDVLLDWRSVSVMYGSSLKIPGRIKPRPARISLNNPVNQCLTLSSPAASGRDPSLVAQLTIRDSNFGR
jgi:ABC-type nitrate/sulfonate/bicarbonate transport system ATPase subunit